MATSLSDRLAANYYGAASADTVYLFFTPEEARDFAREKLGDARVYCGQIRGQDVPTLSAYSYVSYPLQAYRVILLENWAKINSF